MYTNLPYIYKEVEFTVINTTNKSTKIAYAYLRMTIIRLNYGYFGRIVNTRVWNNNDPNHPFFVLIESIPTPQAVPGTTQS